MWLPAAGEMVPVGVVVGREPYLWAGVTRPHVASTLHQARHWWPCDEAV